MQKLQKPENALRNDPFKSSTAIQTLLSFNCFQLHTSHPCRLSTMLGWQPPPQPLCFPLPTNNLRDALLPITINQKPIPVIFPTFFKLFTFLPAVHNGGQMQFLF